MYAEVLKALSDVGFTAQEQSVLHSVLAAIIHLSNCAFETGDAATVGIWMGLVSASAVLELSCPCERSLYITILGTAEA